MNRLASARLERKPAQVRVVSLRIICRLSCQGLLLVAGQLRLQRLRDSFGDLAFEAKDVTQLSIVRFRPDLCVGAGVN